MKKNQLLKLQIKKLSCKIGEFRTNKVIDIVFKVKYAIQRLFKYVYLLLATIVEINLRVKSNKQMREEEHISATKYCIYKSLFS